jgi:hypothetical protein
MLLNPDYDPNTAFLARLWIRIHIRIGTGFTDFVDPDPGFGSRGNK